MQKTIIICCAMVCATISVLGVSYIRRDFTNNFTNTVEHKFNRCLTISMSESRQSGKVISIEEAQKICEKMA